MCKFKRLVNLTGQEYHSSSSKDRYAGDGWQASRSP